MSTHFDTIGYGSHSSSHVDVKEELVYYEGQHRACGCDSPEQHRGRGMAGLGCSYPLATTRRDS